MADSVVSFLIQNLSQLLTDEVKLLSGVEEKVRSLNNELKFIDVFLKSSQEKRSNKLVEEVVSQIIDVAHEAEDVVDTYVAKVTMQRNRNILSKLVHHPSHAMMLHDVDAKIEMIKRSIDEIYKNKDRYGIGEGDFQSGANIEDLLYRRRRDVEEEEVVGLVHDSSFVIKQLKETGPRREVVSIIGMGGLGKTTLARKIYNKKEVKQLFPCCVWAYVSNDYMVKELLLSLLRYLLSTSAYNDLFKKKDDGVAVSESEEELKKNVRECLKGKRYLVVLDDIWNIQVWDEVHGAFPDDNNGSRILITSRTKEVASYTGPTPPYYLPFLSKEESWELFSNKIFQGENCPSELMDLGRSLVESCGGLPLAIVALAGLVAKKDKSQREWSRIRGLVNWHLAQDKAHQVMDILRLSYDSLPQRLKPCFLYFGIYPEDHEILVKELIQLWLAEGFIQLNEIGTSNVPEPEDVASYYLDELVDRSLLQVASRRKDGSVKTCRIHDLLRDFCISQSKAEKFLEICTESNINGLRNPRRLSMHYAGMSYMSSNGANQSCIRSLFLFVKEKAPEDIILKNFQLARLLYIRVTKFESVPSDLKIMIHLKYLKIDAVKLQGRLPAFMYNLVNLETLEIGSSKLSAKLWKFKKLRRVKGSICLSSDYMSRRSSKVMWNLQTFSSVYIGPELASMMENDCFPNLKKLGLQTTWKFSDRQQLPILHLLKKLDTLKLPLSMEAFPPSLTKVCFKGIFVLNSSCMSVLGRLPNLQILRVSSDSYLDECQFELDCGSFLQLQEFEMRGSLVRRWRLEKGAMANLCRLFIIDCPNLTELPGELWSLTKLRLVHVFNPSYALRESLENLELKSDCKVNW